MMQEIVDYVLQYPLVLAGVALFLALLCWKSEEVRAWVLRAVIFILVLAALYFAFQRYKYLIPSSHQPPAIEDNSLTPEDHAGKKYYRDPDERLRESR
jgi:hypothetical protein